MTNARAHGKRVPDSVFKAPVEVQSAFLRGLYGADGCLSRVEANGKANRYVGLGSRSEAMLRDVQRLLSAFGIRGRIYRVTDSPKAQFSYARVDGTVVDGGAVVVVVVVGARPVSGETQPAGGAVAPL